MQMIFRLAATAILGVIISSCSTKEKIIGLKQNIHHDDFEYSVQSVDKAEQIGNTRARGMFYIVAFRSKIARNEWTIAGQIVLLTSSMKLELGTITILKPSRN